jgi:hypothetical protein
MALALDDTLKIDVNTMRRRGEQLERLAAEVRPLIEDLMA